MPTRKMRIELYDSEGNKYTVSFEGQITREKAVRLLDMMELLGGMQSNVVNQRYMPDKLSKYEKVHMVIQEHFPIIWFSSREVQSVYERELKEPISLSTISTYLARMANRGTLIKSGSAKGLKYRAIINIKHNELKKRIYES